MSAPTPSVQLTYNPEPEDLDRPWTAKVALGPHAYNGMGDVNVAVVGRDPLDAVCGLASVLAGELR
jgi:hypothetical protein